MSLRDSENMWVLGGFLGAVALVAALVLAWVSGLTADPIQKAKEKNRNKMLSHLQLPDFDRVGNVVKIDGIDFCAVYKGGKLVGFVGQGGTREGYAGEIEAMVGISVDGKITTVQILRHKETPGLGANVCDRKFQRSVTNFRANAPEIPSNSFLDQFNQRYTGTAGAWKISKDGGDIEYRTGATVSSRAITALVDEIAGKFAANREKIQEDSK